MPRVCPPGKLQRAVELFDRDSEAGLAELDQLARKYGKDPRVRAATGMALLEEGEVWTALPHLEWAVGKEPERHRLEKLLEAYLDLEMPLHALQVTRRLSGPDAQVDLLDADLHGVPESMSRKDRLDYERGRTELWHGEAKGFRRLERLAKRFPDYPDLMDDLATGYWVQGDMDRYRSATRAALDRWPEDLPTLLNAVRLALLEEGWQGAVKLKERVLAAPDGDDEAESLLVRAQAIAFMNEADA